MKKCTHCGKEYPDNIVTCPFDQNPLTDVVASKPLGCLRVRTVTIRRFTFSAICKIVFIGFSIPLFSFCLLSGVLAYFGGHTVHQNDQSFTGLAGLKLAIFNGSFATVFATFFCCISFTISFWLLSKFKPLKLECFTDEPGADADKRS